MGRMSEVLDKATQPSQTSLLLEVLDGRNCSPCDALGGVHHPRQCLAVSNRAVSTPHWDIVGEDAFNCTAVKIAWDSSREVVLSQCPQEENGAF